MIRMPGESYHGPLPPATDELRALEHELRSYVHMLAGEIGERNVFHYTQLVQAAEYIGKTLSEAGYGAGYRYAHDDPRAREEMTCLPESLAGRRYFDLEQRGD